jgi:hypothetical protein
MSSHHDIECAGADLSFHALTLARKAIADEASLVPWLEGADEIQ